MNTHRKQNKVQTTYNQLEGYFYINDFFNNRNKKEQKCRQLYDAEKYTIIIIIK